MKVRLKQLPGMLLIQQLAPVSTPNVTILLSKDGGLTFPTVLVASTPNDGSHSYTVPGGLGNTTNATNYVKAIDNVF